MYRYVLEEYVCIAIFYVPEYHGMCGLRMCLNPKSHTRCCAFSLVVRGGLDRRGASARARVCERERARGHSWLLSEAASGPPTRPLLAAPLAHARHCQKDGTATVLPVVVVAALHQRTPDNILIDRTFFVAVLSLGRPRFATYTRGVGGCCKLQQTTMRMMRLLSIKEPQCKVCVCATTGPVVISHPRWHPSLHSVPGCIRSRAAPACRLSGQWHE
jgi:hypothetical protein